VYFESKFIQDLGHFMRIGIDMRPLQTAHRGAGIGTYTFNLVRQLMRLENVDEWRYLTLSDVPIDHLHIPTPFPVSRPAIKNHIAFWEQLLLPIDLLRSRADVFHATGGLTQVWEICAPYFQPCRTVITVQDLHPFVIPQFRFIAETRAFRWQMKALQKAAHLIAVSQNTKQDIIRFLDIPEERITVVPMAPGDHFQILDENNVQAILDQYHLQRPFVLYVGNYNMHKNIELLVESWAQLDLPVDLVFAGTLSTYPSSLMDRIDQTGRKAYVHFLGSIPYYSDTLIALYNAATAFVFPSLYEGFGLPVVEAMRCGCPVIAAGRGSLPEVVGDAGILIEPDDIEGLANAMQRLIDDPAWRMLLRERGLSHVKKFSWEKTAKETLAVYHQVA
jgi:glycosyltransferase involved in cell wall biosynthesis